MIDMNLRERWLQALRASTTRAHERECDYARSEGDVDVFDPIGLLALVSGDYAHGETCGGWRYVPGEDGAYYNRHDAIRLAYAAGFPPDRLDDLCGLSDGGVDMADIVAWIESLA